MQNIQIVLCQVLYGHANNGGLTVTKTFYTLPINEANLGKASQLLYSDEYYWISATLTETTSNAALLGIRMAGPQIFGHYTFSSNNYYDTKGEYLRPIVSLSIEYIEMFDAENNIWKIK